MALGLAAEWAAFGWDDARHWLPDIVAGWALVACGLLGWSRRPASRSGMLLAATGFAWFVPNFAGAQSAWLAWIAAHALYLYRGPLVHLVVTYPTGRARARVEQATVAAGYAAALVRPVWQSESATIVLATTLVAVVLAGALRTTGPRRRERRSALRATGFLGLVVVANALVRLEVSTPLARERTLLAFEAGLAVLALGVLTGLCSPSREQTALTDLVVELGGSPSRSHRDALARALGDPKLEVAYRLENGGYVDSAGRHVQLPRADSGRSTTAVAWEGREVAVLVHDAAVLDDPALAGAVAASARLAASNARLNAEVRGRVADVGASRRRVLRARDEERRRLETRLRDGPERTLVAMRAKLERARLLADGDVLPALERAQERLGRTIDDLRELAAGLHPRELKEHGIEGALAALAARCSVPVERAVETIALPDEIATAVYFTCAEALANVAKHASASRVRLTVAAASEAVVVEIVDDGVGGADVRGGSGLRGLADRVGALDGALVVDSPRGRGTRLRVELPAQPAGDGGPTRRQGAPDQTN